ncbi:MAG: hypothetical protein IPH08_05820 [Rhodocyclaceae bacterium]|nr:hypothetical protein [Rhodocyclaceae bacterium]
MAVEGVAGRIDVGHLGGVAQGASTAIAAHEAAQIGQAVAVGEHLGMAGAGDIEGDDALRRQGAEFVGLRYTVLIQVAP